ncbi:hypothetical protein [Pseudoalteromonas sp. SG44-8]|uniref:hypothetical protein n=1 Tax=Pseudoalteromonas sp. SG44-8 TaxID=2760958 RepID=UPI0016021157|nr:hypothetical protein [Pseudoalteromonas sp. SG44-8]MBB1398762.1 hypothetical protein [Pseudoalteromonas sp. SG44-8]
MDIVERVKKISFGIVLLALVIMLFLLFGDVEYYGLLSVYVFLTLWSLDKVYLWYFNFDFGIANQLKIKKDAPKAIRLFGLTFVLFVLFIAITGLLQQTAT